MTIHTHPDPQTLLPLLHSHLPRSIPLLRRIQHDTIHPSPTAIILSTLPSLSPNPPESEPWLAAHVDLFRGRETQISIYSSLERSDSTFCEDGVGVARITTASSEKKHLLESQLRGLMWYIKTHILPVYLSSGSSALAEHEVNDPTKIPPSPPSGLLIGSIHTGVLEVLISESGLGSGSGPGNTNPVPVPGIKIKTLRLDTAYGKYIFTRDVFDSSFPHDLPEGYTFGKLGDTHYDLVRSRTRIYRSDESLRHMHGVGVYRTDQTKEPIGWAFISLDGSLATLHVEPGHRGKGLAVQLAKETMRRGDGGGDGYAHTDVDLENSASRRVMEKIGGQLKWTVAWVVVEVVDL